MTTTHTRSALEHDLEGIRSDILRMGSQVETSIERSVQALKECDADLAQEVINHDEEINQLRYVIEEECLELIAAQAAASGAARCDLAGRAAAGGSGRRRGTPAPGDDSGWMNGSVNRRRYWACQTLGRRWYEVFRM